MKYITIIFLIATALGISCYRQTEKEIPLKVSNIEFQSIFGRTTFDEKTMYCLLGTGFFRTPRSANVDSLITDWLASHKEAVIVPVSSFSPTEINNPDSKMIFCLVIQNSDTLNNYLIKNGCFPGGTMIRPSRWDEMEPWEKEFYEETAEMPSVEVIIDSNSYNIFLKQIENSELYARKNKLGIWENEKD